MKYAKTGTERILFIRHFVGQTANGRWQSPFNANSKAAKGIDEILRKSPEYRQNILKFGFLWSFLEKTIHTRFLVQSTWCIQARKQKHRYSNRPKHLFGCWLDDSIYIMQIVCLFVLCYSHFRLFLFSENIASPVWGFANRTKMKYFLMVCLCVRVCVCLLFPSNIFWSSEIESNDFGNTWLLFWFTQFWCCYS